MTTQAQLVVDINYQQIVTKNMEVQMGKIVRAQNTRPQRGLPSATKLNLK